MHLWNLQVNGAFLKNWWQDLKQLLVSSLRPRQFVFVKMLWGTISPVQGEVRYSYQLVNSRDCFKQHAQPANNYYQFAIWRRCLHQNPHISNPVGHGWKQEKEDGGEQLVIKWMDGQTIPEAVLHFLPCKCCIRCTIPRCVSLVNGLEMHRHMQITRLKIECLVVRMMTIMMKQCKNWKTVKTIEFKIAFLDNAIECIDGVMVYMVILLYSVYILDVVFIALWIQVLQLVLCTANLND